jgi:tetratricopeptide (TPR) repeat protein
MHRVISGGVMGLTVVALLVASWHAHGEGAGSAAIPALYQSSYALEAANDIGGALAKARDIVRRDPDDYVGQLRVGWLLYLNKQYDDSAAVYRTAVKLRPTAVEPKLGLMLPLMAASKNQDALTTAEAVLAIDRGNYLARSRKAYLLYQLGRYAKAEVEYRAVLEQYPSDVEMMAGLAWSLIKQGRCPQARGVFTGLLHVAPQHSSGRAAASECE